MAREKRMSLIPSQGLFKEKKDKALAMFGSSYVVEQILEKKVFEEYNIELENKDYATVDELLQGIKAAKRAKYVLISDTALVGIENGKYEVIKQIKEQYKDITIAMFFNEEKRDETYKNWAFGYKVYHLYYVDAAGAYNFDEIVKDLVENALTSGGESYDSEELRQKEELIRQKEHELAEKESQLSELEKRLEDAESLEPNEESSKQAFMLKEQIRKMHEFKREAEDNISNIKDQHELEKQELERKFELERKKDREKADAELREQNEIIKNMIASQNASKPQIKTLGCITIGVFSISNGAGSTFTAVEIAERLGREGYPTALVACDDKKDINFAGLNFSDKFVPEEGRKNITITEAFNGGYNFVVEDFGCLFQLDFEGRLIGSISDKKEELGELLRCNYVVALGFSTPWHLGKLNYFFESNLLDPFRTIYSILGHKDTEELWNYGLLTCERDTEQIMQILFEWLGIKNENKKEESKKRGFFGRC